MADCAICKGSGNIGPVHINRGSAGGEWLESVPCGECGGTGKWSDARSQHWRAGQAMRAARINAGESIREAARQLGLTPSKLSAIERGRMTIEDAREAGDG